MRKTILIIVALLVVVAVCADRIGFTAETKINGLVWMTRNTGGDKKDILGGKYDFKQAQTACPDGWRLPTRAEYEALIKNRSRSSTYKDLTGRWFSGSEPDWRNAPAVFLPRIYRDSKFDAGYYWTSTPFDKNQSYALVFNAKHVYVNPIDTKNKVAVRCVKQ